MCNFLAVFSGPPPSTRHDERVQTAVRALRHRGVDHREFQTLFPAPEMGAGFLFT